MTPHILIVDDDDIDIEILERCLKKKSYRSDSAMDIEEAVAQANKQTYDIIMSDFRLNTDTGDELVALFKANDSLRDIPIIILSGDTPPDSISPHIKEHHVPIVLKDDIGSDTFFEVIEKALSK